MNKKVIGWIIVLVGIVVAVCIILSTKPKEAMEWDYTLVSFWRNVFYCQTLY